MRVICPHCQKPVTLLDTAAEQAVPCPECGQTFTAPALLAVPGDDAPGVATPLPDAKAAPAETYALTAAPVRPAAPIPPPPAAEPPPAARPAATVAHRMRFVVRRGVVHWFGPAALIILFLLTFFSWVGAYPGGYPLYTQSAWQVMSGGFTTDGTAEGVFQRENALRAHPSGFSWLMFITLLTLIVSVPLALGEFIERYVTVPVPDVINRIWPHRLRVLLGLSLFLFALLSLQMLSGMGLEWSAAAAGEDLAKQSTEAKGDGTRDQHLRDLKKAEEVSRLGLRYTGALWLGYFACGFAALGFALELSLLRRGTRPDPVVEVSW